MEDVLYLKTDKFEHQTPKEDFINAVSYGEDFANWLISETSSLNKEGFVFSEPIMEDYGHGLKVENDKDHFWVALSFAEEGPTQEPAHWVITVATKNNFIRKLFNKTDESKFHKLRNDIWAVVKESPEIKVFSEEEWMNLS